MTRWIGLLLGPILGAIVVLLIPSGLLSDAGEIGGGLSQAGKAVAAVQARQLPEGGATSGGLLPPGNPSAEPVLLKRQITHALRNNPEQVREMFLNWIEEKE